MTASPDPKRWGIIRRLVSPTLSRVRALPYGDVMAVPIVSSLWITCVPSVLSSLRVVLAVGFVFLKRESPWRPVVVLVAATSDLVDGYLARRFGVTSWQGGLLDAIADKLFTLIVLVAFVFDDELAYWQVLLLLLRDITVALAAGYIALIGEWPAFKKMSSRIFGKATTTAMFVFIMAMLFLEEYPLLKPVIITTTATFSVLASADYAMLFVRGLKDRSRRESG